MLKNDAALEQPRQKQQKNKLIVIPDSFKGSLSSMEVCEVVGGCAARCLPGWEVQLLPVADGGEGTVDCFVAAAGFERVWLTVQGPFGEPVKACYARRGGTAVVEMAQAAGLPMAQGRLDPERASTYGVGQLLRHAVEQGCRKLYLGLGGSCTDDAGAGAAAALGAVFLDEAGRPFVPVGGTLRNICAVNIQETQQLLQGCTVTAMCDIDSPLYGEQGAAYIFGPQKGADAAAVRRLDGGLRAFAQAVEKSLGKQVAHLPGAGAAGGFGAGVVALLGGRLQSGIQTVLELVDFDRRVRDARLVITGEGRLDGQSLRGKVVLGVAQQAGRYGVPVVAVAGSVANNVDEIYSRGVTAAFSICRGPQSLQEAMENGKANLALAVENILRFYAAAL